MMSLQELSLKAVPNPGEQARKVLPPWHMVRIAVEERDFNEMRDRFREAHKLRFRYVLIELRVLEDLHWTLPFFPRGPLGTEESGYCREDETYVNVWTVRQKKWPLERGCRYTVKPPLTASSLQLSFSSVTKMAVAERLNCSF